MRILLFLILLLFQLNVLGQCGLNPRVYQPSYWVCQTAYISVSYNNTLNHQYSIEWYDQYFGSLSFLGYNDKSEIRIDIEAGYSNYADEFYQIYAVVTDLETGCSEISDVAEFELMDFNPLYSNDLKTEVCSGIDQEIAPEFDYLLTGYTVNWYDKNDNLYSQEYSPIVNVTEDTYLKLEIYPDFIGCRTKTFYYDINVLKPGPITIEATRYSQTDFTIKSTSDTKLWWYKDGIPFEKDNGYIPNRYHSYQTFTQTSGVYYGIQDYGCGYDYEKSNEVIIPAGALISGIVYNDSNRNGQPDMGEDFVKNKKIILNDSLIAFTDSNGKYNFDVKGGKTYSVKIEQPNDSTQISNPSQYSISVPPGSVQIYSYKNFGLLDNIKDFSLEMYTSNTARPGFPLQYNIVATNSSIYPATGAIEVKLDSLSKFNSCSSQNATINQQRISIPVTLNPFQKKTFYIETTTFAHIGDTLKGYADLIIPDDQISENNHSRISQIVRGSFDPNDKSFYSADDNDNISSESDIIYTIRFQNTGTDTAFTVTIADVLDNNLDLTTFEIIGASHPYELHTNGRQMVFSFLKIMLPDSNVNEPLSHGFITYKIKPTKNCPAGTLVKNKADIYFDFNDPVATNVTEVIVKTPASLAYTGPLTGIAGNTVNLNASTNSDGLISYSIIPGGTGKATINGNMLTLIDGGNISLKVDLASTSTFTSKTKTVNFTITNKTPVITLNDIQKTFGDHEFNIQATSNSTGKITYSIESGSQYASVTAEGKVNILGAGDAVIKASQKDTTGYNSNVALCTLNIAKVNPVIYYTGDTIGTAGDKIPLSVYNNSGGAVTYFLFFQVGTLAILDEPDVLTLVDEGTVYLVASFAGNENFNPYFIYITIHIKNQNPQLSILKSTSTVNETPFKVIATSNSPGNILFYNESQSSSSFISNDGTFFPGAAGKFVIKAVQQGTPGFNSAVAYDTIIVNKAIPVLGYSGPVIGTAGDEIELSAGSNSPGNISYRFITGPAVLNGNKLLLKNKGTVSIEIKIDSTADYTSKVITQDIYVINKIPVITFENIDKVMGDADFNVSAISDSPGKITYSITTGTELATITPNGKVSIKGAGFVVIKASQKDTIGYDTTYAYAVLNISQAAGTLAYTGPTEGFAHHEVSLNYNTNSDGHVEIIITSSTATGTELIDNKLKTADSGTVTIQITVYQSSNYLSKTLLQQIKFKNEDPQLVFNDLEITAGDTTFFLNAISNSLGSIHYEVVSGSEYADISAGGAVKIHGSGVVVIKANQDAALGFNSAAVTATLTINFQPIVTNNAFNITNSLKLYPNPTTYVIVIEKNDCAIKRYSIKNEFGVEVLSGNIISKVEVDVSSLAAGTYLLEISDHPISKFVKH